MKIFNEMLVLYHYVFYLASIIAMKTRLTTFKVDSDNIKAVTSNFVVR